jgi:molybdopterin-containing oxidoreductase family iron-sulfur binding subunit
MKMLLAGGIVGGSLISLNAATGGKLLSLNNIPKVESDNYNVGHEGSNPQYLPEPNLGNMALGMVIDLEKCDGCEDDKVFSVATGSYEPRCTSACRVMHNVPPDQEWIKIIHRTDNSLQDGYYFPRPCMQCQNPPCVNVCPVGAAFHRPRSNDDPSKEGDGLVLIKYERCIGCRTCMAACPYEVRYFNWSNYGKGDAGYDSSLEEFHSPMYATKRTRGTVEKCDFCAHFAYLGKTSACTAACPKGAIYYGNLKENTATNSQLETINVRETVTERNGFRFKEDFNTRPRVFYLPKRGGNS